MPPVKPLDLVLVSGLALAGFGIGRSGRAECSDCGNQTTYLVESETDTGLGGEVGSSITSLPTPSQGDDPGPFDVYDDHGFLVELSR